MSLFLFIWYSHPFSVSVSIPFSTSTLFTVPFAVPVSVPCQCACLYFCTYFVYLLPILLYGFFPFPVIFLIIGLFLYFLRIIFLFLFISFFDIRAYLVENIYILHVSSISCLCFYSSSRSSPFSLFCSSLIPCICSRSNFLLFLVPDLSFTEFIKSILKNCFGLNFNWDICFLWVGIVYISFS